MLAQAAGALGVRAGATIEAYKPFPVDVLPEPMRALVEEGAAAMECEPAFIALPMLATTASAIGNTRRLRIKQSWPEPAVLWAVAIAESGSRKSPPFDLALEPLRARQKRAMKEYKAAVAEYRAAKESFEAELRAWKKGGGGERPEEPEAPTCERVWCSDTTVEALADRLDKAPRGLLVARDELSGWLASFNQYKAGRGGDVAHWLEMHRAGALMVDRKTGDNTTIHVARAAVCITGTIQPQTLRRCLTTEFYDNGLAARLLLAMPPRRRRRWTESDVEGATRQTYASMVDELLKFQASTDVDGDPEPADVTMSDEAKSLWVDFYNTHAGECFELHGELAAAWSKLEGYTARLALIVHCARQASGEGVDPWRCDEKSMAAAIALTRWFAGEAKRVYAVLGESEDDRKERELIEAINRRGGTVNVRELKRGSKLYPDDAAWRDALDALEEAGIGQWVYPRPGASGGRPKELFRLLYSHGDAAAADEMTKAKTPSGDSTSGGNGFWRSGKGGENVPAADPADAPTPARVRGRI